jgi:hypothetical protein
VAFFQALKYTSPYVSATDFRQIGSCKHNESIEDLKRQTERIADERSIPSRHIAHLVLDRGVDVVHKRDVKREQVDEELLPVRCLQEERVNEAFEQHLLQIARAESASFVNTGIELFTSFPLLYNLLCGPISGSFRFLYHSAYLSPKCSKRRASLN